MKLHILTLIIAILYIVPVQSAKETKKTKYNLAKAVFVILSQNNPRHAAIGNQTKNKLVKSLKSSGVKKPLVFTLHDDLTIQGGWTLTPLMPVLIKETPQYIEYYVFLDEASEVNIKILREVLSAPDSFDPVFIGHALNDTEPGVLHHHDQYLLKYPDLLAGFVMSRPLVSMIAKEMAKGPFQLKGMPVDHSIDVAFELAKTVYLLPFFAGNIALANDTRFCVKYNPECAVYPIDIPCEVTKEESLALVKETFFAVKTCKEMHADRLPIIQSTWAEAAENIIYVSEEEDPKFGTLVLPGAEINTILGHCNKTQAIMKYFVQNARENNWRWLVIADDDTMLSVGKLMDAIQCYDNKGDEKICIGEKFGFRINGPGKKPGADFPPGGSSIVFNLNLAEAMMDPTHDLCTCQHPGYPDDIHLGECMYRLNITMVHHNEFHQLRPEDYNQKWLALRGSLSFHKFDRTDPAKNYDTWFRSIDQPFKEQAAASKLIHKEL